MFFNLLSNGDDGYEDCSKHQVSICASHISPILNHARRDNHGTYIIINAQKYTIVM